MPVDGWHLVHDPEPGGVYRWRHLGGGTQFEFEDGLLCILLDWEAPPAQAQRIAEVFQAGVRRGALERGRAIRALIGG